MELHEVFSVRETLTTGVFSLDVELTDMNDERYRCEYMSAPDDTFGLAPAVREAVLRWIADGKPISPYVAPAVTSDLVDIERDRRISAGFMFNSVKYQSRPEDRENIAGSSQVAFAAMVGGAQPGNFFWHGGSDEFVWIAEDNTLHPMDAQTMFEFGKAAMAHKQAMIFKARAIKDIDPIPANYADDTYWS